MQYNVRNINALIVRVLHRNINIEGETLIFLNKFQNKGKNKSCAIKINVY